MQLSEQQSNDTGTVQAYGALLTRLNDSLLRAREALSAHSTFAPGGSLAELDAMLAEFVRRRVRIALYGEVKAGKSTLLNAIAGTPLSPSAFDPLTSIPVRVTHGPTTTWRVGDRRLTSIAELEQVMRAGIVGSGNGHVDSTEVVVETNLDLLELGGQVDLLDTPGVGSNDAHFDAVTADTVRSLDAVVLVVRYPALFTQFTRRIMDALEADIGKLFVVWNLDATCSELSDEECARYTETLRADIAGAHELFRVDARAGLNAAQVGDTAAVGRSGLTAFREALRRFAASGSREIAALRETSKRAQGWLSTSASALTERHGELDRILATIRQRLQSVQTEADTQSGGARGRFAELEAAVARLGKETIDATTTLAGDARRELRTARRQWVRSGDLANLEGAVESSVNRYADAVESRTGTAVEALRSAAAEFGTSVTLTTRPRTVPPREELSSSERSERAVNGRWQRLRRSLWKGWYLPGLARLESEGLDGDLRQQSEWLEATSQAILTAGRSTLETRLADIRHNADDEAQRIKDETNFTALDTEWSQLTEHLPVLDTERTTVTEIAAEARTFLKGG